MEFRSRDYTAEAEAKASSLPRIPADSHPLASSSPSPLQVVTINHQKKDISDPLSVFSGTLAGPSVDLPSIHYASNEELLQSDSDQLLAKEWTTFKKLLLQKFPGTKVVSVTSISSAVFRRGKEHESSSTMPLNELADLQPHADEEGITIITQQEYVTKLTELKSQINQAWKSDDRVTSLKLSIKVARLLMDTAVSQFYPTLFSHATDILDMLGDLVWQRITLKAVSTDDISKSHSLPENFLASDIYSEAKETCYNWFCKIGSIRELLPRIYLELAILPCWRFLNDNTDQVLSRILLMMRGLADPLASSYCLLYMIHCGQKMRSLDRGHLIQCIDEVNLRMVPIVSPNAKTGGKFSKSNAALVRMIEPIIEFVIKCLFQDPKKTKHGNCVVKELGLDKSQFETSTRPSYISLILHHLIKVIPTELIDSSALDIVQVMACGNDASFPQFKNFRLLGFRLCEQSHLTHVNVLGQIIEVISKYDSLNDYLNVVDAYVDILLQIQMRNYLQTVLDGIASRACSKWMSDSELESLSSILVKILTYLNSLEDALQLAHFTEILDFLRGRAKYTVNALVIRMATRDALACDHTTIQFLFEVAQGLYSGTDSLSMMHDDSQQLRQLLSRFVQMVDYGEDVEQNLTFLVNCRGAFDDVDELKETLVHSCNRLAIKAKKGGKKQISFIRSCLAFCEVTIPAISDHIRQINLYLETAEVALMCGLFCHSDELLDSAMIYLQNLWSVNGCQLPLLVDGLVSAIRKLCSLLVLVPGDQKHGVLKIPKKLLSIVTSQPWVSVRLRIEILCGLLQLLAALSQNKLPYHINDKEVLSNDQLYVGDTSYNQELESFCACILQTMVDAIQQEQYRAACGSIALEACNCIASALKMGDEVLPVCEKLMEIAKSSSSANDQYLHHTMNLIDRQLHASKTTG